MWGNSGKMSFASPQNCLLLQKRKGCFLTVSYINDVINGTLSNSSRWPHYHVTALLLNK